jgi:hypothetical protein
MSVVCQKDLFIYQGGLSRPQNVDRHLLLRSSSLHSFRFLFQISSAYMFLLYCFFFVFFLCLYFFHKIQKNVTTTHNTHENKIIQTLVFL